MSYAKQLPLQNKNYTLNYNNYTKVSWSTGVACSTGISL